jgi:glycosyltransferase involved in cell wall biosynthesis
MVIMRILYLLSSLGYGGAAKEALLLARGLARSCDLRVVTLQGETPWTAALRETGVAVHSFDWTRPFDPSPFWRLRRLLHDFRPDRIHVWRLPALRSLALVGQEYLQHSVISHAVPRACLGGKKQTRPGLFERWLLRRVAKIVAGGPAEAECLQHLFGPERVSVIPPGVELGSVPREISRLANSGKRIVCVGNLEPNKGFREALRAADYLVYPFGDLHFYVVGDGPFLPALQRARAASYHQDRLLLLGERADASAWLAGADVCWVPSLGATGRHVALEAMAAGRPVIASDVSLLREIITDGHIGLLVPPGDQTALARTTRQLFLDDARRRQLGEAARQRVRQHFGAADFIERCRALYGLSQPAGLPPKVRTSDSPKGWNSLARAREHAL